MLACVSTCNWNILRLNFNKCKGGWVTTISYSCLVMNQLSLTALSIFYIRISHLKYPLYFCKCPFSFGNIQPYVYIFLFNYDSFLLMWTPLTNWLSIFFYIDPLSLRILDELPCYLRQAILCFNCLRDKCLLCTMCMSTAFTQYSSSGSLALYL